MQRPQSTSDTPSEAGNLFFYWPFLIELLNSTWVMQLLVDRFQNDVEFYKVEKNIWVRFFDGELSFKIVKADKSIEIVNWKELWLNDIQSQRLEKHITWELYHLGVIKKTPWYVQIGHNVSVMIWEKLSRQK